MQTAAKMLALGLTGASMASAEESTVAPIVLLHGVTDSCPKDDWTTMISESIKYEAPVKCVEIGDGKISSMFERI